MKHPEHLRSFGRRKSHGLSERQDDVMQAYFSALKLVELKDLSAWFEQRKQGYDKVALEIGFGGGEHLIHRARSEPDTLWIGAEPFINGVVKLVETIACYDLQNIIIHDDDVRPVLDALPDACISKVFILYPDPWHKQKHKKRRLVNDHLLQQLATLMAPGGQIHVASDIQDYISWACKRFTAAPWFEDKRPTLQERQIPYEGWISTRYEQKAFREGRTPTYLTFERNNHPAPRPSPIEVMREPENSIT